MYGAGETKYPPCLNPKCKSYGKSHPNCRCWGSIGYEKLAEGGETHFCSESRDHDIECEQHPRDSGSFVDHVMSKKKGAGWGW